MKPVGLSQVLTWVWRGKSITRAFMNATLTEVFGQMSGTTIDLGGGGRPSYLEMFKPDMAFFNMDMLAEARPSFVGNLERVLPLRDGIADNVILLNTLEHVFDYQHVVGEMHRIVKNGGRVLVFVPFMVNYHTYKGKDFFVDDYFRYTRSALQRIFDHAGFAEVRIRPVGGLFWVIADLLNIAARFRLARVLVTVCCGTLEFAYSRLRKSSSAEQFPLGYFVEAEK